MNPLIKEGREWITCVFSLIVPFLLWAGHVSIQNQRLQIAAEIRGQYVPRDEYSTEVKRLEGQDESTWRRLGETNGKIDALTLQAAGSMQILLDLKEEVKGLKR